jgi:hypothetical protein
MRPGLPSPPAPGDPAAAFDALRGEVSLLRRALEGLTAERQVVPDYTPTLTAQARRLSHVEELLGDIAGRPALRLTPESMAESIARAGETVRAGDRATAQRAMADLRAAIATIDAVVEQARTAERQLYLLCASGLAGLCIGAIGGLALARLAG